MEKKKRHRRTKAEMIAYRNELAQKKTDKYLNKINKKLESKGHSIGMTIKDFNPVSNIDDGKFWELVSITGTETEMNEFYNKNKNNCIAVPYLYYGNIYKVNYWTEKRD